MPKRNKGGAAIADPSPNLDPTAGANTGGQGTLEAGSAAGRMTTASMVRSINLEILDAFQDRAVDGDGESGNSRTVVFAVSSEFEVLREWPFEGLEILDHSAESIRLDRFKDGAAVIAGNHWNGTLVAANRDSWVGDDRRLWIRAEFATVEDAERELTLIREDIRKNVSIRYRIYKMEHTVGEGGAPDVYRATDWEPIHTALVNDPEDPTVGFGREAGEEFSTEVVHLSNPEPVERERGPAMPDPVIVPAAGATEAERAAIIKEARELEREAESTRRTEILTMGRTWNCPELAMASVERGDSVLKFKDALLDSAKPGEPLNAQDDPANLGMDEREAKRFSFFRALRYLQDRGNPAAKDAAGLEIEASDAIAAATGHEARGLFIPTDVLRSSVNLQGIQDNGLIPSMIHGDRVRSMLMGRATQVAGTDSLGGYLVPTEHLAASFIDVLRNTSAVMQRATVLTGLSGNVDIPKKTVSTAGTWVATEGADTAADDITFGNLPLTPNDIGAHVVVTRRLLQQSSPAVEDMIRTDLAMGLALGIDAAAINGAGAAGVPEGFLQVAGIGDVVLGAAAADPAYSHILALWKLVAEGNALFGDLGWMMGAAHAAHLMGKEKFAASGKPIMEDFSSLLGYGVTISEQCPADTVAFLNFRQVVVGMWGGVDMLVDPYTNSKSASVLIRAIQTADVGLRQTGAVAAWQDSTVT